MNKAFEKTQWVRMIPDYDRNNGPEFAFSPFVLDDCGIRTIEDVVDLRKYFLSWLYSLGEDAAEFEGLDCYQIRSKCRDKYPRSMVAAISDGLSNINVLVKKLMGAENDFFYNSVLSLVHQVELEVLVARIGDPARAMVMYVLRTFMPHPSNLRKMA